MRNAMLIPAYHRNPMIQYTIARHYQSITRERKGKHFINLDKSFEIFNL